MGNCENPRSRSHLLCDNASNVTLGNETYPLHETLEQFPDIEDEASGISVQATTRAASQHKFSQPKTQQAEQPKPQELPTFYYYKEPEYTGKDRLFSFSEPIKMDNEAYDHSSAEKIKRAGYSSGSPNREKPLAYDYTISTPLTDFLLRQREERLKKNSPENSFSKKYASPGESDKPQAFYLNYDLYESFGPLNQSKIEKTGIEKQLDIEKLAQKYLDRSKESQIEKKSNSKPELTELEQLVKKVLEEKKDYAKRSLDDKQLKNLVEMESIVNGILTESRMTLTPNNDSDEIEDVVRKILQEGRKSVDLVEMESVVKEVLNASMRKHDPEAFYEGRPSAEIRNIARIVEEICHENKNETESDQGENAKEEQNQEEIDKFIGETFAEKRKKNTIIELVAKAKEVKANCQERYNQHLKAKMARHEKELQNLREQDLEEQQRSKIDEDFDKLVACESNSQHISEHSDADEVIEQRGGIDLLMSREEKPKEKHLEASKPVENQNKFHSADPESKDEKREANESLYKSCSTENKRVSNPKLEKLSGKIDEALNRSKIRGSKASIKSNENVEEILMKKMETENMSVSGNFLGRNYYSFGFGEKSEDRHGSIKDKLEGLLETQFLEKSENGSLIQESTIQEWKIERSGIEESKIEGSRIEESKVESQTLSNQPMGKVFPKSSNIPR